MPEFNKNLWAPWRMAYIRSLGEEESQEGCFLCRYWETPDRDVENHVIWRGASGLVVMNRFPYTNGHLLISVGRHEGELVDLTDDELAEMGRLTRDAVALLKKCLDPHGFNVGYNLGRCAGAGLPGHLHAHIVPRWNGDTNYMPVLADVRVVPDALDTLYDQLAKLARSIGLRA